MVFCSVIPYISLTTIRLLNAQAFEFEEPQENFVSQKDSFCSYSEKIINLLEYYQNLRSHHCYLPEELDDPSFPEKTFQLSKRLVKGCKCESEKEFINLGENYFPKNLSTLTCLKTTCCNDAKFECQEIKYIVPVLTIRKPEEYKDPSLHHLLSSHWRSESVEAVAACVCLMRKSFH